MADDSYVIRVSRLIGSLRKLKSCLLQIFGGAEKVNCNIVFSLQHSCTPCAFVQNVFVDTHDLRFPWVAFFAGT